MLSASVVTVPEEPSNDHFARAKLPMLAALGLVSLGLAVAGTIDKTVGGVLVVSAWALGVVALHRLGRAGSSR